MANRQYVLLDDRAPLAVAGPDNRVFLQGLISNDVTRVTAHRAVHAAFLTAQGKYLHDFFVVAMGHDLVLDCEAARCGDLARRLRLYKLRSRVTLEERGGDLLIAALLGNDVAEALGLSGDDPGAATAFAGGMAYLDPRLSAAGARAVLPRADAAVLLEQAGFTAASREDYDRHRIALGLADGSRDMEIERTILLECGFDELHGVDWSKGCFLGQELTARTKYRGLIKKRLVPVAVDGSLPAPGTPIVRDGHEVGEVRSGIGSAALAMLRLDALNDSGAAGEFTAGEARLTPRKPSWATF